MKKKILTLAVIMAVVGTGGVKTLNTFAYSYGPGYVQSETSTTPNQAVSLSDYMRTVYGVTQYPELDEAVYNAFRKFETNKNSSSMVTVYTGSQSDCKKFRDYFNLNYGYTNNLRVTLAKSGDSYSVVFINTLNADAKINEYLTEVKKAQEIAKALNGGSTDATIKNVIAWVQANAKYYYGKNQTNDVYISHYYGIYSQNEIVCEGYAMAVYQLCAMNGVKASLVDLISPNNIPHAVNQVTYSDRVRWVDTTRINPVSDELWSGYSYLTK